MRAAISGILAILLTVCCVSGCKFRPEPPPELPKSDIENELPPPDLNPVKKLSIGDVEAVVEIRGSVAEESRVEGIRYEELVTPKQRLTLVSAYVDKPYPTQLWLRFELGDILGYDPRPVVVRGKVLRQIGDAPEETIDVLNSVIGVSPETIRARPDLFGARQIKIDVLGDLPEAPETMMVRVEATAMLLPDDTDLGQLDPAQTTAPPLDTTILRSNPVRIEFTEETAGAVP